MTEKQMTSKEFEKILTALYAHHLTNPDLFNGDVRAYDVAQMLKINKSFFIKLFSTELAHAQQTPNAPLNTIVLANRTSGVDFLLGILSQDPRFEVFYTKEQFGEHLFNQCYRDHIEESLQPFLQIDYEKMAEYEFANDPNVYFIYRNKKALELDEPELILVLKDEYHDYYDQLN